jgi:hypothetical protein
MVAVFSKLCHLKDKYITQFTIISTKGRKEVKGTKGIREGKNGSGR